MRCVVSTPFGSDPVPEVYLPSAPVAVALAQVQFPELSSMANTSALDTLATRLAQSYPVKRDEQAFPGVMISENGFSLSGAGTVRVLASADDRWQLRIAPTSLTLTSVAYTGRREFIGKIVDAWEHFVDVAAPPFIERTGVRYVNVVSDAGVLRSLSDLVRAEVLGPRGVPLGGAEIDYSVDDSLFRLGDSDLLQVRTGILPQGTVLDPVLGPLEERSWVLDLDASQGRCDDTSTGTLAASVNELAARAHRYFRWAVHDEFLTFFGGE